MIYVYITNELKSFEAYIRDLCLAFFSFRKITYIHECVSDELICFNNREPLISDIVVKDFFSGKLVGERIKVKSEIKRQLYNYLKKITGKKLLWGTLTGIRPVTIVTNLVENFLNDKKIINDIENKHKTIFGYEPLRSPYDVAKKNPYFYASNVLKEDYYVSDSKINELLTIAHNELEVLERKEIKDYKKSYSIYIGVPFCKSTCLYCSFTSFNIDKYSEYVSKYLNKLEDELKINNNNTPLTLYIGGGTPTSLSNEDFEKMLSIVDKYIIKINLIEYTVEAGRPDTITKEKLMSMKKHGVTRISINPQSMNQKTLDLIGRKHKVEDVKEKFYLARNLGFDNINMDIILGLPNEHLFDVLKTLNEIRKLKPDSLTIHSLALKRAARLNYEFENWTKNYYLAGLENERRINNNKGILQEGKREIDKMFYFSSKLAYLLSLKPYYLYRQKNIAGNLENVGYAKDGKECIYNIMMMSERHSVYGFGTATTKEVFYEKNEDGSINKRIESKEGYKSVIDYCR